MFNIGQKVCLWQISTVPGSREIIVLKEVIVTITEIKTGVPYECSGKPVNHQSLLGMGDDGKQYDKHWENWPESQSNDYSPSWSIRDDGVFCRSGPRWIPVEAVYIYGVFRNMKQRHRLDSLVDQDGVDIEPKGDVIYCERHDSYNHTGADCVSCSRDTVVVQEKA